MNEIEKLISKNKENYQNTSSEYLDEFGWDELRKRIGGENPRLPLGYYPSTRKPHNLLARMNGYLGLSVRGFRQYLKEAPDFSPGSLHIIWR